MFDQKEDKNSTLKKEQFYANTFSFPGAKKSFNRWTCFQFLIKCSLVK